MPGNIAFSILTYVLAVALGFFINYLINKLKISKANVSAAKIIDIPFLSRRSVNMYLPTAL